MYCFTVHMENYNSTFNISQYLNKTQENTQLDQENDSNFFINKSGNY